MIFQYIIFIEDYIQDYIQDYSGSGSPYSSGRGEVEHEVTDTEYVSFGELAKYSMIFDHYNFDSLRFVFYT